MLLSFIEDLIESPIILPIDSEYQIYLVLIKSWLLREESKSNLDSKLLLQTCAQLAYKMQSERRAKISSSDLDNEISKDQLLNNIKTLEIKGRSLLNKNSDGDYRFSHYSIQEFLVVYHIINYCNIDDKGSIFPTDFINKLLEKNKYQIKMRLKLLEATETPNIEAHEKNKNNYSNLKFHNKKEINDILKESMNFFENNTQPFEDELDIPTFLRRQIEIKSSLNHVD